MNSTRIYQTDPYCKEVNGKVIAVSEKKGKACFATDVTVFYPEGGGQPSDIGTAEKNGVTYSVTYATDKNPDDIIFHETDAPIGAFEVGDEVKLTIDWDSRFVNMQRHCGEHMLSGAIYKLYGGVNKGFHMGADYIAIDIELGGRILTFDEVIAAEELVNAAIRDNLPVEVKYFDSYEESRVMPVRKDVPHEGVVSVVVVGDEADPFDCIACCGTHPRTSAEVGVVSVYKIEPNKGMTRIFFDCGRRAIEKLKHDYSTLTSIANSLSTSNDGVPHKLEIQAEREANFKAKLADLSAFYKEKEFTSMMNSIEGARHAECGFVKIYSFENKLLDVNELLKLGFQVQEKLESDELLVLNDLSSNTVLILSDGSTYKCGEIAKKKASQFGGRGGGRPDNARVAFKSASDAKTFIESLANSNDESN